MKKTKYTQPIVEKVDRMVFPGEDQGEDIEAEYTCSGTGWNSGTGRGCLELVDEEKEAKE